MSAYEQCPGESRQPSEGLERIGCCCGGVLDDYRRRLPFYVDDFRQAATWKTVSSACFMFFATFASTVALGVVIEKSTRVAQAPPGSSSESSHLLNSSSRQQLSSHHTSYIGVTEYLLMNSVAGMVHALAGCQPLLVLRPTGPITAFVALLFNVSQSMGLPFQTFFAWTGVFVGVYMSLMASLEVSRHIRLLTRFLHDIFAFFVCTIYILDGVLGTLGRFDVPDDGTFYPSQNGSISESLFALILTAILLAVAFFLHGARKSTMLTPGINGVLVDYALSVAALACILVSVAIPEGSIFVERIYLPSRNVTGGGGGGFAIGPTFQPQWGSYSGTWSNHLLDTAGGGTILAAAVAGVPITIFFFFDQNVSSLLCQKAEMHLSKGSYFHSSFQCMAVFNAVAPAFGLPFVTGSLPHSPQLVSALTLDRGERTAGNLDGQAKRFHVYENRVAPFMMYFCIGAALVAQPGRDLISQIPTAAVDGILIFVGVSGLFETQLWARLFLLATDPAHFPPAFSRVGPARMHLFTAVQLVALGLAWALNGLAMTRPALAPLGLCFPLVIVALVPFRLYVMPHLFTTEELDVLDNEYESDVLTTVVPARNSNRASSSWTYGRSRSRAGSVGSTN